MTDTSTSTAVSTTAHRPPITVFREKLIDRRSELRAALGSDAEVDSFIRALVTAAQVNPEIQACTFSSVWLCAMKACRDGLQVDGTEAVLIPFKSTCSYVAMYRGLLKKFRESGQCKWVGADVVRDGEEFRYFTDEDGVHFRHVPGDDATKPITKVYAAAKTHDGAFYCAVLTMSEIEKIKRMSKATREDSPWKSWPEEMAKKSALRRLAKLLPSGRIVTEEDEPPALVDAPSLAPAERLPPLPPRPASAADALQAFAGGAPKSGLPDAGEPGGGGEPELFSDETAAASADNDPLMIAHKRGQEAKAAGLQRRAMPGEYRGMDRIREQQAWAAGYDDQPMPEGTD